MRIFSYDEIDELGEGLIRQYLGADAERTCCVDIEGFATEYLKLPLLYRSFAEQDTDKIGFIADGITPLRIHEDGTSCLCVFPKGTIVIERSLRRENESGRRRFTISHECAHYLMDKTIPAAAFHREFDGERDYTPEDFRNLFSFHETLIDRMGAALLMPRFNRRMGSRTRDSLTGSRRKDSFNRSKAKRRSSTNGCKTFMSSWWRVSFPVRVLPRRRKALRIGWRKYPVLSLNWSERQALMIKTTTP